MFNKKRFDKKGDITINTIFVILIAVISIGLLLTFFWTRLPNLNDTLYCNTIYHIQSSIFVPKSVRVDTSVCENENGIGVNRILPKSDTYHVFNYQERERRTVRILEGIDTTLIDIPSARVTHANISIHITEIKPKPVEPIDDQNPPPPPPPPGDFDQNNNEQAIFNDIPDLNNLPSLPQNDLNQNSDNNNNNNQDDDFLQNLPPPPPGDLSQITGNQVFEPQQISQSDIFLTVGSNSVTETIEINTTMFIDITELLQTCEELPCEFELEVASNPPVQVTLFDLNIAYDDCFILDHVMASAFACYQRTDFGKYEKDLICDEIVISPTCQREITSEEVGHYINKHKLCKTKLFDGCDDENNIIWELSKNTTNVLIEYLEESRKVKIT